jgi:uncharacterized protein (TIGR03546 family)
MFMIRWIYRLLSVFETHGTPQGISFGVCVGMLLALAPTNTLHFWIFFSLVFLLQINLTALFFSWFLFLIPSFVAAPLFKKLGLSLLISKPLFSLWAFLYDLPVFPYTEFYNPEVLGKLIFALLGVGPFFILALKTTLWLEPIVYHWWRTTKLYTLYRGYKPYATK